MIFDTRKLSKAALAITVGFSLWSGTAIAQSAQLDADFDQKVREALLRNPEIILEVFHLLEANEEAAQAKKDRAVIARVSDQLFDGLDPTKPILVEFQDYNCGYCRRVHPTVMSLKEANPDLQVVIMETPVLGQESVDAAKTALALKALKGEAAYQEFSDALMSLRGNTNPKTTSKLLSQLGHDPSAVSNAVAEGLGSQDLERAQRIFSILGGRGTPFFVGPSGIVPGAASADRLLEIATADAEGSANTN